MYAVWHAKSLAVVNVLLEAKAEVNARDRVSAWKGNGEGCFWLAGRMSLCVCVCVCVCV